MLGAPSTSSGNANSSECWSPLMSGSANAICNADGTSKMLSCENMFMAKGKLVLTPNLSNNRCSCCGSQPDRLPVASIRNCDSLSAPPTPATTEKFKKRAQDKQPSSEVIKLVEEWGRGENQMAKEVSLYQPERKRLRSDRDIPVLYEETPDRLIRVENNSTDRETKAIDLLGTPNKRPQRKKHRPKVFKEGKPSRTPKLATSPSDTDGSSCKRKYVRRNKDVIHSSEKENTSCRRKYARRSKDVAHSSNTNAFEEIIETESKGKAKYSRRCLNFDSEEPQAMEEFSAAMLVFKKVLGDRSHHEVASCHPQNALVPYAGHGSMMVPYDRSFELVKRRRPRAKVDLDPESNRVWKLLMGKDCGEGGEPPDVDKEKWWDEERRVFQGRVDSFIARMHLVQGDRRYSQWKGSVVDSVVGVFLTQNVSDHLSRDYLLSIRGLGLKSAECVRLLTLRQLAFPVDTNVGRICVRLGWVPLQPLPESLQLHLLELYPVLATIQKYLWPRLCKLDQLTLYELHYQMITFGKVFCTKSKPNCNSCPMRGECRHFASAFARYEIPDTHPLLEGLDPREPDDPSPYLLAIWTPGETTQSTEPPKADCNFEDVGQPCERSTCFGCNSMREEEPHKIRGTLLIPCRTAMRGSFPLNGTYFQVNEVFADHYSSREPVHVLRDWIWNLPKRTVYFGTSIPTIFKGLTTEGIQQCFWRGFVCVRGFDRVTRAPKPLYARLHFPASKTTKNRNVGEPKVEKNNSN